MRIARRLVAVGLFVAALVFGWRLAAANGAVVSVNFLAGEFTNVPLWAVLLIAFGSGILLAGLAGMVQLAKLGLITRRYRKTAQGLEAEVHQLRNLPLSSEGLEPDEAAAAAKGAPPGALERSV